MEYKLADILKVRIKQKWYDSLTFSSSLWKAICEVFLDKKNMDITQYLISISKNKNTVFIKTNKPVLNASLLELEAKFLDNFKEKIGQLYNDEDLENLEIKYL